MAAVETVKALHGMKALRELKKSYADGSTVPTKSSHMNSRAQKKIDATYEYFTKEVDPLIGECITHLLCTQPENAIDGMLNYFQRLQTSQNFEMEPIENKNSAKSSQRLYLATQISPILSKLINRLARSRPKLVLDFICTELQQMKENESTNSTSEEELEIPGFSRPQTAMNRLESRNSIPASQKGPLPPRPDTAPSPSKPAPTKPTPFTGLIIENNSPQHKEVTKDIIPAKTGSISAQVLPKQEESPIFKIQYTVIGNAASGKTSFLNCIQGDPNIRVKPTTGFKAIKANLGDNTNLTFYDLGGSKKVRGVWEEYYHDCHGLIFVLDATEISEEECQETKKLFENAISHRYTVGKPILIISNKQDKINEIDTKLLSKDDIHNLLQLDRFSNSKIFECCSIDMIPKPEPQEIDPETEIEVIIDSRIDEAIEWLVNMTKVEYNDINPRVLEDTAKKFEEDNQKKIQKDRNVLKKKIASAFADDINPANMPEDVIINPNDVFDKEEGVKFLSGEIGIELTEADKDACLIAAMVGYQRLALQMVGAMHTPTNKKKTPMTWSEIKAIVEGLRAELGLGPITADV